MTRAPTSTASRDSAGSRIDNALRLSCVLGALAVNGLPLLMISTVWRRSEFLAHGYLIPPVSLFLVYVHRQEIAAAVRSSVPPASGPLIAFLAASIQMLFVTGDVVFAAGLGIAVVFAATAYAIGGRRLVSATALPIGLLLFMVPPPAYMTTRVLFPLKVLVTKISVALLQTGGATVAADGNRILIPDHILFVADACSGLSSTVTLLPLGVVVAYFLSHGIWRRALIVLSVVPLSIGANVLRVTATTLLVSRWGIGPAHEILHNPFGLTTYIVGTLALLLVARLLR